MESTMEKLIKFFTIALAYSVTAHANTIGVAVIDTGIDLKHEQVTICSEGHKDFTTTEKVKENNLEVDNQAYLKDIHGHGTHVAGLISKYAKGTDFCIVSLKYYTEKAVKNENMIRSLNALAYAISLNVSVINYSGGGTDKSQQECQLIKQALDKGIIVVTAAGNESTDLNKGSYYPAQCDERVVVVGSTTLDGKTAYKSNYGDIVTYKEIGQDVKSTIPGNSIGTMSGTSQATAIVTGKIVKLLDIRNKYSQIRKAKPLKLFKPKLAQPLHIKK